MKRAVELLTIDPQNDFCDLPPDWCPDDPHRMSPVGGFEAQHKQFLDDMARRGVGLMTCQQMLALLENNA